MATVEAVIRHQYRWATAPDEPLPSLPGFVLSSFSPLVALVADRCLSEYYAEPSVPTASRQRTAVLVVSRSSDLVSAEHVRRTIAGGDRIGPLFFYQSAPNSVVGQIATHWGLGGPVVCISPVGDPLVAGLAEAALLLEDGDADEVLLILVEQGSDDDQHHTADRAHALVVGPGGPSMAIHDPVPAQGETS